MGREKKKLISYVSLFSGAMGLDIGLEEAGFKPVVCNEKEEACISTIRANRPKLPIVDQAVENIDVQMLNEAAGIDLKEIDLVAGGPPCQSFSVYGNRLGVKDGRGKLIFEFVRLVSQIRPKVFLMENVRGLHSMSIAPKSALKKYNDVPIEYTEKGSLLGHIFECFEEIGYRVDAFLVNVVNYGGPQIRERLLCIGNRYNLKASFPAPQYSNRPEDELPPFRTLSDAIGGDFVDPDPALMDFSPRKLRYLSMVPSGGNWRSLPVDVQKESMGKSWYLKGGRSATWRKLSMDFPSPTVVTMPNHASTSMCHPTELRALTAGECAAIQEFPRTWRMQGTAAEKYRQIGNAVPPRLARVAGGVIKEILDEVKSGKGIVAPGRMPSSIEHIRPHVRTRSYWRNGTALAGDTNDYYNQDGATQTLPLFDQLSES